MKDTFKCRHSGREGGKRRGGGGGVREKTDGRNRSAKGVGKKKCGLPYRVSLDSRGKSPTILRLSGPQRKGGSRRLAALRFKAHDN